MRSEILENPIAPIYSIGTVARILGVSVHTLRMYDREGLILPYKSAANQRWYSKADVERIRCIRSAINEQKMSIEGIKRMHAMIPCWKLMGCSTRERSACEAFRSHDRGCWNFRHMNNRCAEHDCRLCEVYHVTTNCEQIKETIIRVTNDEPALTPSLP